MDEREDSEGRLNGETLVGYALEAGSRAESRLIESLNELLYSLILAVRKTLGAEHEQRVMRVLRDIRGDIFVDEALSKP